MVNLLNYCLDCNRATKHTIVFEKKNGSKSSDEFTWHESYQIVECNGCGRDSFRYEYNDQDMWASNDDESFSGSIETYPLSFPGHTPLEGTHFLPSRIRLAYKETILALHTKSFLLASAGFRSIIEAICLEHSIKGNLKKQIDALATKGLLTKKEANRLHSIRFLGNDSLHEINVPSEDKIRIVVTTIEHLLSNLYILDKIAQGKLDTIITTYDEFEDTLWWQTKSLPTGDKKTLKEILGSNSRRIEESLLKSFESRLAQDLGDEEKKRDYQIVILEELKPNTHEKLYSKS